MTENNFNTKVIKLLIHKKFNRKKNDNIKYSLLRRTKGEVWEQRPVRDPVRQHGVSGGASPPLPALLSSPPILLFTTFSVGLLMFDRRVATKLGSQSLLDLVPLRRYATISMDLFTKPN